jgi:hypothetical protein
MICDNELQMAWKDTLVALSVVIYLHLPGRLKKNYKKKNSVTRDDLLAES